MRLSRLSDRQLRRLVRNADVRFGDVDKEFKRHVSSVLRKIQNIRLEVGQLRHESQNLGIPEFKKQLAKLDQSVESAYSALIKMDFEMKQ